MEEHNGRAATFGHREQGSNQTQIHYLGCGIQIIQALASNCDPAIGGSLVGGDK